MSVIGSEKKSTMHSAYLRGDAPYSVRPFDGARLCHLTSALQDCVLKAVARLPQQCMEAWQAQPTHGALRSHVAWQEEPTHGALCSHVAWQEEPAVGAFMQPGAGWRQQQSRMQ